MADSAHAAGSRQADMVLVPGNPPPEGAEIIWYNGEDGIRLRMLFAPKAAARALAIVCPGRTESIEKYFEVMRDLQARNFALVCLDWPGQGLSDRPLKNPIRGHVTTFETYVDALVRGLAAIAAERGQSLAQMAVSWTLRDPRVTSTLLGASSAAQLRETAAAASRTDFTPAEIAAIDEHAVEAGIDLWREQSRHA